MDLGPRIMTLETHSDTSWIHAAATTLEYHLYGPLDRELVIQTLI